MTHRPMDTWYNRGMSATATEKREVREEIARLVEANRTRCLWFAPADYLPATDAERIRALIHIEQRCDRATFQRARELRRWLSQHTSDQ